ncbi:MAG: hypothetical protein AB4058_21130 [Microcystaceae cyanobacterium]
MSKLCYPTVDLFIYDLRSPLNAQIGIDEYRQFFQSRFKEKLGNHAKFIAAEEESAYSGYQTLLKPNFLKLETDELKGYFYPVLLNDTYGLLINASIDNKTEPQLIESSFPLIEQELNKYGQNHEYLTIGQTQILSGWLTEGEAQIEQIAKDCYKSLGKSASQWSSILYGQGTFLTGHIFEIWKPISEYLEPHVLIILFPDQETHDQAAKDLYFRDWIRLFCYRHKIMWTYSQSRTIKDILKNYYREVERITERLNDMPNDSSQLDKLQMRFQEIQSILDKFTRDLLKLNILKETIEINLDNYEQVSEIIKDKAGKESDLIFLDKFIKLTKDKYLEQINKDKTNMKLGLQLLESNIGALRSQIELEKSERERNFQNLVALIGGGTAAINLFDFEGEKCQKIADSWPFSQFGNNSNLCNQFLVGGVLTPVLLLFLVGIFALSLKWIIRKVTC